MSVIACDKYIQWKIFSETLEFGQERVSTYEKETNDNLDQYLKIDNLPEGGLQVKVKSKRMLLSNKPDKITCFSNKVLLEEVSNFLSSGLLYCSWCMWDSRKMLKWKERLKRVCNYLQASESQSVSIWDFYCTVPEWCKTQRSPKDWITYKCLHLQNKWFARTANTSPPMKSFFTEDFCSCWSSWLNPCLARKVSFFEKKLWLRPLINRLQ